MSKSFEDGIGGYIHAQAMVDIYFPVDKRGVADVNCFQCYFFRKNYGTCGLNGEVCQYPSKYVGSNCPLENVDKGDIDGNTCTDIG